MKKIILAVGARPNFVKVAPLYYELKKKHIFNPLIVHTGQHYDHKMSQIVFENLELPEPNYFLGVGSRSHSEQTALIMLNFEKLIYKENPDLVIVFGDVNSTIACSLTAKKMLISVAHVEAGLRSFDETMPEEINRKVTDAISDILFTPSKNANRNLLKEGIRKEKIFFVGNIMIDSLIRIINNMDTNFEKRILGCFKLRSRQYMLVTLHRPSNVDDKGKFEKILNKLNVISNKIPMIFPVHPRTEKNLKILGIGFNNLKNITITKPLSYKEFICLEKNAKLVLTDSGGVQEETTFLKIPCLTLRPNTERPVTIDLGTNNLADINNLEEKILIILSENQKETQIPPLWDGKTAKRICEILEKT